MKQSVLFSFINASLYLHFFLHEKFDFSEAISFCFSKWLNLYFICDIDNIILDLFQTVHLTLGRLHRFKRDICLCVCVSQRNGKCAQQMLLCICMGECGPLPRLDLTSDPQLSAKHCHREGQGYCTHVLSRLTGNPEQRGNYKDLDVWKFSMWVHSSEYRGLL